MMERVGALGGFEDCTKNAAGFFSAGGFGAFALDIGEAGGKFAEDAADLGGSGAAVEGESGGEGGAGLGGESAVGGESFAFGAEVDLGEEGKDEGGEDVGAALRVELAKGQADEDALVSGSGDGHDGVGVARHAAGDAASDLPI